MPDLEINIKQLVKQEALEMGCKMKELTEQQEKLKKLHRKKKTMEKAQLAGMTERHQRFCYSTATKQRNELLIYRTKSTKFRTITEVIGKI